MTETSQAASACNTRDDLSLLIRKFNAKLSTRRKKSGHNSGGEGGGGAGSVASPVADQVGTLSGQMRGEEISVSTVKDIRIPGPRATQSSTTTTTATEESSTCDAAFATKTSAAGRELPLDDDGRIKPYVDFSQFNRDYAKWTKKQQEKQQTLP